MAGKPYQAPENIDRSKVVNIMPEHARGTEMKPWTPVICVNRGPTRITDKYDGNDYEIEPYMLFEVTYGAALHLQKRAIVPGTRNPDLNDPFRPQMISWIGIHGVDPAEACEPFSPQQLEYFGEKVEGLAREMLPSPVARSAEVHATADLSRTLPGQGLTPSAQFAPGGSVGGVVQELIGGSDELRDAALERVEGSDARAEEADARNKGYQPPAEETLRTRSDDAPKQRDAAPAAPPIGKKRR